MDFFAHIMWAIIIFGRVLTVPILAFTVFFTILPDLIWGIPVFSIVIYKILKGEHPGFSHERREYSEKYEKIYNTSHSFLTPVVLFVIASVALREFFYPIILGYFLHLIIDIFVHKESYFHQRPLFPLSSVVVKGFLLHLDKRFIIANWSIIIILFLAMYVFHVV